MYRQGDLLFVRTSTGPHGMKRDDGVILGSSVTGHTHRVLKGTVYSVEPDRESSRWGPHFFVIVPEGGTDLVHEEHATIPLSEGTYEVIRQREVNGLVID